MLAAAALTLSAACALKAPPDAAKIKEEALPGMALPGQWTAKGAGAGDGRRQLARHVPRRAAERRRRRGDRLQRRPSRRRGTRRAGAALRQAGGCEALSIGRLLRARRRQDVGRRLRYSGRGDHPELGARPLGPRQVRPRRGSGRRRLDAGRFRVRAAVDRCGRRAQLVPGHRGRLSRRSWRGRPSDAARIWCG